MFKYLLTKEEFDALTDEQKAFYKESGGNYQLQIEGMPEIPDVSGLQKRLMNYFLRKNQSRRNADRPKRLQKKQQKIRHVKMATLNH